MIRCVTPVASTEIQAGIGVLAVLFMAQFALGQATGIRQSPPGGPPSNSIYRPFPDQTVGGSDTGLALVYRRGPLLDSGVTEVCLSNLGTYDPNTGTRTGDNFDAAVGAFVLRGKYVETGVLLNDATSINRLGSSINDFRIDPSGAANGLPRQSILWASEAHLYYFITDYRERFANDAFILSLGLPAAIQQNLLTRQFRPDLQNATALRRPIMNAAETAGGTFADWTNDPLGNGASSTLRREDSIGAIRYSLAFEPDWVVAQYAGLLANWLVAGNAGFPSIPTFGTDLGWRTNISPTILEGFKLWTAYRYTGNTELFRATMSTKRVWAGVSCGTTNLYRCDKGWNIDNVMMYLDTADPITNSPSNPSWPASASDDTLLFPYRVRSGVPSVHFGPTPNASLGGMFIAALFYDISKEVGLGDENTDKLFWKTLSLIDPAQPISMTTLGAQIQNAARALWPDTRPGHAGQTWYEQDLVEVLTSRGIRTNGSTNFVDQLPPALGTAANGGPGSTTSTAGFGSSTPDSQRNSTTGYNFLSYFINGYQITNQPSLQYVAYQFYKYSKFGPADDLWITNGTFSTVSTNNPAFNGNGTWNYRAEGRSLSNVLVLAAGSTINFMRDRQSAVSEREGYYAEDVRPIGFRVTKAIINGFSIEVARQSSDAGHITYQLSIVDPSLAFAGQATYAWTFTAFDGTTDTASGQQVTYVALRNQPITIQIGRTRGAAVDSITLRERGNDLDRNSGKALVKNFFNGTYDISLDSIRNRRCVEGHGSYNSALNPVGGAFGVQGRRWVTPTVGPTRPKKFWTVSHGLGSGSNQNGPYHFESAVYYNACIWSNTTNCSSFPGGHTDQANEDYEVEVPFSQVGIDLASPFAIVTAGSYPAYLWSVSYPDSWLLQPNHDYVLGSHISASVVSNGYSYNVCSYIQAPWDGVTPGNAADRSDWLAGANWSGNSGAPPPQTMRQYLASPGSVSNATWAAYKFEGQVLGPP